MAEIELDEKALRAAAIAAAEVPPMRNRDQAAAAIRAYLAALPARQDEAGVRVAKPLEWVDTGPGLHRLRKASTPFGYSYFVNPLTRMWIGQEDDWAIADDPEAAAQADYERRIRSALVTQPPAPTSAVTEEMVERACPAVCRDTSFGVEWEDLLWCISQETDPIKRMIFEQKRDRVRNLALAALEAALSTPPSQAKEDGK